MKKTVLLFVASVLFASCATMLSGTKANVQVSSPDAPAASVKVDGGPSSYVSFPATVEVPRKSSTSVIEAETETKQGSVVIKKKFNSTSLLNIFLGGIPGFIIDAATGAIKKPEQGSYTIFMKDKPKAEEKIQTKREEQTPKSDDAIISTIVRWYIDSEPRGSRIFWRVVSGVPDEVKNTNELYLGATPYESTRSFDILGLTYENSRNVQIEIKVTRQGYMDQVKRFNVRQALDQREISAFFELVTK